MKKLYFILGIIFLGAVSTSCEKEVSGISMNQSTLTIEEGQWQTLTVMVTPNKATDKPVNWVSQNAAIASVVDGIVFGNMVGKTTIIAKAGNHTTTCEVTVVPQVLARTTWEGLYNWEQCTVTFTNDTDFTINTEKYGEDSGTYSIREYPKISLYIYEWDDGTFSGQIIGNTMTLSTRWGSTITLTKQ